MPIFLLIFLLLLIAYSFLIEYYRRAWNNIPEMIMEGDEQLMITVSPVGQPQKQGVKVSLIVPMRNEAHNIERLVKCIAAQTYPSHLLQVIFVDDHSDDDTWQNIRDITSVTSLQLPADSCGKKRAIERGILSAMGELIITTDADCTFGQNWISAIVLYHASTGAKFIAAPVKMISGNTFSGIFQSLDFLTLQGITGASVHKKFHTLCNGANLAYEKQAFIAVNGFEGIDKIPSGDDMFLMHKIFSKYPNDVHYLKSKAAIVETPVEPSVKRFFNQRIRWASKGVHYDDRKVFFILLLAYAVNVAFFVMAVASIVNPYWLSFLFLLFVMKLLIEFPFVNAVSIFFGQQKLMKFFPLMQPFHIMYTIIAGWLGRFGSYEWKARTIKNKGKTNPAKQ